MLRSHSGDMRSLAQRILTLMVPLVLTISMPLEARKAASPEENLREWASANRIWLQDQITPNRIVPDPDPSRRRLVISYALAPEKHPQGFHRSAIYDNALAALAFIVLGDCDSAAFTLHALARLVRSDGSLWFGYNTANDWPSESDHDGALIRVGAIGWVGYALTFYLTQGPSCAGDRGCERERAYFLHTAVRLGEYLLSLQVNDPRDGRHRLLRLGTGSIALVYRADLNQVTENYTDGPNPGISTENNISAWFFLRQLASLTGASRWREAAESIRAGLLKSAWNDTLDQFNEGFDVEGMPDTVQALDCASWGALFLMAAGEAEKARRALAVVDSRYAARDGQSAGFLPYSDSPIYRDAAVGGFFFPGSPRMKWRDLNLVWSEGTLGVALAHLRQGRHEQARQFIEGLRPLQVKNGGLAYASRDLQFHMRNAPSAASAAWLILVVEALCGNRRAEEFWR